MIYPGLKYLTFCIIGLFTAMASAQQPIVSVGAARPDIYVPLLNGKRIALFSNHTGTVDSVHTLDIMIANSLNVTVIFSPEHGFRGNADAGERVKSSVDKKTGIPVISLYDSGASHEPTAATMKNIDIIVTDIQDVGLRFYTYYCTMIDLMNAAASYGKEFMILDRPNPNGMTVDGPILDMRYASPVGRLPIPVLHGMTLGELAKMAIGEGWLDNKAEIPLTVVKCLNYTHATRYRLPIAPSPNLPDMKSIYLYPSTCFFEATKVSLGRGTDMPFTVYGHPQMKGYDFTFTPQSRPGAKNPPQLGRKCYGRDLRGLSDEEIIAQGVNLEYIIDAYRRMGSNPNFFSSFFEKLIGTDSIRKMIEKGFSADEIRASWQDDVTNFKSRRKSYLLYPEE